MDTLATRLAQSNRAERLAITTQLVTGMQQGDSNANTALYGVCLDVASKTVAAQECDTEHAGEFGAFESARLVRPTARVQGYLGAIAKSPQAETIIDAGCGSSALLSIGSAILHPNSEVIGFELNGPSAACATKVVQLLGLDDRVTITEADVLTDPLPQADLAVTETFHAALLTEQGTHITAKLATVAKTVLPATAKIYATNILQLPHVWEPLATTVDLAMPPDEITGKFVAYDTGLQRTDVFATYYDAQGQTVLAGRSTDTITAPRLLGYIQIPKPNTTINFSYTPSVELSAHPAKLWLTD